MSQAGSNRTTGPSWWSSSTSRGGNKKNHVKKYEVEKLLEKRTVGGKNQYFLKCKGYSAKDNSWQPEENTHCPDLLQEFEDNLRNANRFPFKKPKISGFDRGLIAEEICRKLNYFGELHFVMMWKDTDEPDLVIALETNLKSQELVIAYYNSFKLMEPAKDDRRECEQIPDMQNT